ncbi:MAG TPA: hypothetical protein VNL98_04020 [Gemmatimonadales bacterium]|nr:hypothetical protein [Gemmatimonadales bacterium]
MMEVEVMEMVEVMRARCRRVLVVGAIAAVTAAVGCGDDGFGPDSNLIGIWAGSGSQGGRTLTLNMTISSVTPEGAVTGTGTVSGSVGVPVNIGGTFRGGAADFSINATGFISAFFRGRAVDRNSISGTLNGSGFSDMPLTLRRQ